MIKRADSQNSFVVQITLTIKFDRRTQNRDKNCMAINMCVSCVLNVIMCYIIIFELEASFY